jgi:hypothetical protein
MTIGRNTPLNFVSLFLSCALSLTTLSLLVYLLKRYSASIPWRALTAYYAVSTPLSLMEFNMPQILPSLDHIGPLHEIILMPVRLTQAPLSPLYFAVRELPIENWSETRIALILTLIGIAAGWTFACILRWLASRGRSSSLS